MKVLHLLTSGSPGGIEILCNDIGKYSDWDNYFCFVFDGGKVYDKMKKENMNVIKFSKKKISIKKLLLIIKIIKKNKIQIINIHHCDIFLQLYFLALRHFFPNIKFVTTIHSCYDPIFYKNDSKIKIYLKDKILLRTLDKSDLLLPVSKAGLNSYKKRFDIKSKMSVIYNGISDNFSDFKYYQKIINDNKLKLLYVGRLIDYKGIMILLEAIKFLKNNYNFILTIVGDGPKANEYKKYVEENNLNNYVVFVGFDLNTKKYYKTNDIFIYPSICDEVFGISIVEAMAYGLTCITFDKGGIPEIITNSKNGFIVKEVSSISLSQKLELVFKLYKENKIININKAAIDTSKKFLISNTIKNLKKEYYSLLGCDKYE